MIPALKTWHVAERLALVPQILVRHASTIVYDDLSYYLLGDLCSFGFIGCSMAVFSRCGMATAHFRVRFERKGRDVTCLIARGQCGATAWLQTVLCSCQRARR